MKQREYLKLMLDCTTLNTKTAILQEQIVATSSNCEEAFTAAEEKLAAVQTALANVQELAASQDFHELATVGTKNKKTLQAIQRELTKQVEAPVKSLLKQLLPLKESLQKIQTRLQAFEADGSFNLTAAKEKINQSQLYIESSEQELQTMINKLSALQEKITKHALESSKLMFEQELAETAQKTTVLARRISNIEQSLAETPELATRHEQKFTPLKQALETLTTQTKLLSVASDATKTEETNAINTTNIEKPALAV